MLMRIQRTSDCLPVLLLQEYRRLNAEAERRGLTRWMDVDVLEPPHFQCRPLVDSWLMHRVNSRGADWCSGLAFSQWIRNPVVVRPTEEQEEALDHVAVELELGDVTLPFPCVYVETPKNSRFFGCLCYRYSDEVLVLCLQSPKHDDDICTMIRHLPERTVERSLEILDEDVVNSAELSEHSLAAQRLAVNMCLLLSNHPCTASPALPKEAERDARLGRESTERGERARRRAQEAVQRVEFAHEVVVRRQPTGDPGAPTGREMPFHWVRGHWKMQAHGEGRALRKRILIRPYCVRADRIVNPERVTGYRETGI